MRAARVVERRPLVDSSGRHVRAGSGLAWWGERLAVVQDDTRSLALVEPRSGHVEWVPFGEIGADRKADKLDLEALVALGSELWAFGSGSTLRREVIVRVTPGVGAVPCPVPRFYRALRDDTAFSGSELNLEGAARDGAALVLRQRGNGAPSAGRSAVNASARVRVSELEAHLGDPDSPPPTLRDVRVHQLGTLGGVRLTFTDAASAGGRLFYLACAEASPDTYRDGVVVGSAIGVLGEGEPVAIEHPGGRPFTGKAEGLALESDVLAFVVLDADDADTPADLCTLELLGL